MLVLFESCEQPAQVPLLTAGPQIPDGCVSVLKTLSERLAQLKVCDNGTPLQTPRPGCQERLAILVGKNVGTAQGWVRDSQNLDVP